VWVFGCFRASWTLRGDLLYAFDKVDLPAADLDDGSLKYG
jgi:hypothetical protein